MRAHIGVMGWGESAAVLLPVAAVIVLAAAWVAGQPGTPACNRGTAGAPAVTSMFGPQTVECVQVNPTWERVSFDGLVLAQGPDTELAFPDQVLTAPDPEAPALAAGQAPAALGTTNRRPAQSAAPSSGGAGYPPTPDIAYKIFRQLGLPLPQLLANGTFANSGAVAVPGNLVNTGTGGDGAPSNMLIDGTINGKPVANSPAQKPATSQPAPPPASQPAPPAPPLGAGGPGSSDPGTPGLPGTGP